MILIFNTEYMRLHSGHRGIVCLLAISKQNCHLPSEDQSILFYLYDRRRNTAEKNFDVRSEGFTDSKLLFSPALSSSKYRRNLSLIEWIGSDLKNIVCSVTDYKPLVRSHLEYDTIVWSHPFY